MGSDAPRARQAVLWRRLRAGLGGGPGRHGGPGNLASGDLVTLGEGAVRRDHLARHRIDLVRSRRSYDLVQNVGLIVPGFDQTLGQLGGGRGLGAVRIGSGIGNFPVVDGGEVR